MTELRKLLDKKARPAIGVFNAISALLCEKFGFEILYLSGAAYSGSMALPDLGVITLTEVKRLVDEIRAVTDLPLIVDVDTGYGEAINVYRTVKELERAGANAIQIEDQVMPKKCGHLEDKQLVNVDEMVKKIRMAMEARKKDDFLIIARTDARTIEGIKGAIERAKIYLEAGADVIFPEALESYEEFKMFSKEIKAPLVANMTEFGKTPYLTLDEFREAGYDIVLFPVTLLRASLYAMKEVLKEIKEKGTQKFFVEKMMSRKEFYELINYQQYIELDKKVASSSFK
ncbi:MAG: methylisocitrate lyase [Thermoproteota archaeon]|jgi:methylisocitrate lyase|nr:methylisocitrate lyase [Thermoproteota archaeon]